MAPVDAASLGVFRIGFGVISAWEIWRAFDGNLITADYELRPYLFRWWLFEWVRPLPGRWLYVAFAVTGIAALLLAAGLFYRTAAIVHFLGISYWILLEKAAYLNHRYLTAVIGFLLIFVRADAVFSLDAKRKPWVRSPTLPTWTVWLMRFQVGVPYFFSGVAKLNFDWLVRNEPLRTWLRAQTDFPFVGQLFTNAAVVRGMALASTVFDLSMPFLLLYRKTRAPAFLIALGFHFMNSRLFEIGIFPWLMIVATTVFFDPDWPRRLVKTVRTHGSVRAVILAGFGIGFIVGGFLPRSFSPVMAVTGGAGLGVALFHMLPSAIRSAADVSRHVPSQWRRFVSRRGMVTVLAVWVCVQVLVPLRHFAIPGNVNWTEEGQRFAWQLLVRQKAGTVTFRISGPGAAAVGALDVREHLSSFQIGKLVQNPDMIMQFAQYIEGYYRELGVSDDLVIRADTNVSLNGRPPQPLIDPNVDLTTIGHPYLPPAPWIEPLAAYE